jgi:hypothetical protein
MDRSTYTSPPHKLIACFRQSRDQWRARAKAQHLKVRQLQIRVRDLEASRDHWRTQYYHHRGATTAARAPGELP